MAEPYEAQPKLWRRLRASNKTPARRAYQARPGYFVGTTRQMFSTWWHTVRTSRAATWGG